MNNKMLYDFEGFRVDTNQKCLWRDEEIVSLTPKAFDTLLVLIRNKGSVVSKDTILDEVWKDTFVEESTLAQNISTLRKTLAKYDKDKEFITTIPRRGYRFVANVTELNTDEEVLVLEKHSVTHIVAEQEHIHDSAETAVSRSKGTIPASVQGSFRNKKLLIGLPLALIAVLFAGVFAVSYFSHSKTFYNSKFQKIRINNLLSGGDIKGVIASPDGKYIAKVKDNKEGDTISLRQVKDGNTIEILPKSDLLIIGTAFSPKSDYIYYSAYKKQASTTPRYGKLYKIPILGGAPQEILKDIDSPVAISEDSKKIAFVRNKLKEKQSVIIVSNEDGSEERELAVQDLRSRFSNRGISWSPDGKLISAVTIDAEDEKLPTKVVLVNAESGEITPLTKQNWLWIGKTTWLKDGSGIALIAYGNKSPNLTDEIWFISYPEGEARLISNGIHGINGISLTDDADSIIATTLNRITSSNIAPLDDLEHTNEITKTAETESLLQLGSDWSSKEKIVYSKTQNGNADIWIMNSDGTKQKQLTADSSADYVPKFSADGRNIFFLSNRSGSTSIWRMEANGENPTQIIKAQNLFAPTVSNKNDFIYYSAKAPGKFYNVVWKADFNGENIEQLTSVRSYIAKVSPDGKYIFSFYPDIEKLPNDLTQPLKLTILSAEDGKVVKQFASLKNRNLPSIVWQKDSKGFLILERENGISTLSVQMLENDEPQKLKEWKDENVYQITLSSDGEKLFFEKGKEVNNVIQFKDISSE